MTDILDDFTFDVTYDHAMLIAELKYMIKKGWEISWFTTDKNSFSWEDINTDVKGFLKKVKHLDFKHADIGYFNPKEKKTEYESYEMNDYMSQEDKEKLDKSTKELLDKYCGKKFFNLLAEDD